MAKSRRFTPEFKAELVSRSPQWWQFPSRSGFPTTQSQRKSTLTVEATPP